MKSETPARSMRLALAAELCAMFVLGPLAYVALAPGPGWLFPALWVWGAVALALLLLDRGFDRRNLWNARAMGREVAPMLGRFALLGLGIAAAVAFWTPDELLRLPKERPRLWVMIMVLYPLFSVYPQEIIFRTFFFHRYAPLFGGGRWMIAASAAAFGYVHIVFLNWIAVPMTIVGGIMFGLTYARSRSTLGASLEHALYGCLVFTIGLGRYFYSGETHG